jgi:hypothetical protein
VTLTTKTKHALGLAWNVLLVLFAVGVVYATLSAVNGIDRTADSASTAAAYSSIALCDAQLAAVERSIDTRTWVALTSALSAPLTNGEGSDAGSVRTALLGRAEELALVRQDVALYRFHRAKEVLEQVNAEGLIDFTCPPVPQVFQDAANLD